MSETTDYINDIEDLDPQGHEEQPTASQDQQKEEDIVSEPQDDMQETVVEETISTTIIEEVIVTEAEDDTEDESLTTIKAGEFSGDKKEDEGEEVQQLHTKYQRPIPVIDHRLLVGKLSAYDWLADLPQTECSPEVVEVRFKNTRKAFFSNPSQLPLKEGDIVAVEAALGHDSGIISLAGELVKEQMRMKRIDVERNPLKKVYRKAKPHDIEKWQQAIALEHETMIKSRKIAADLKLNMKIGDVEYQGDKTKAIFYYIADDRVDFRTLIKVLAESFRIRIEMKQIGARQEAGRIGGIGPCDLKLCCSTFITNFISVSTSAARYQDISLNPQKLAGQCGKLKCCLNYEVDAYIDAQKDFPSANIPLNTGEGMLYHQKTDIFGQSMSYTPDKEGKGAFIQIPIRRIKEIIAMNRKGVIPPKAVEERADAPVDIKYTDGVGEESLSRFDEKKQKRHHPKNRNNNNNRNNGNINRDNGNNNRENGNNNAPRNENNEREGNNENGHRNENNGHNNRQNNNNNNRPNNRPNQRFNNQRNNNNPRLERREQRDFREQRGPREPREPRNDQKNEPKTE